MRITRGQNKYVIDLTPTIQLKMEDAWNFELWLKFIACE
jgi:hypothetical protein